MFSIKRTPEKEPCYTDFSGVLCILWKNSCKQKNDNKKKVRKIEQQSDKTIYVPGAGAGKKREQARLIQIRWLVRCW